MEQLILYMLRCDLEALQEKYAQIGDSDKFVKAYEEVCRLLILLHGKHLTLWHAYQEQERINGRRTSETL
jgi:hypothetical protein